MATDPFSILRQAAQEYANEKSARDPYAIGSQAFAGLPNGNFDNPWTNMAISLTKGLGSGYLGGVAQNNANQYLNQGISGMLDAYKGGSVSDPLMLPYAKQLQANKMFMDEARAADLADWKAQQQFGFDQSLGLELARNGVAMPSAAKSPLEPAEMSMDSAPMSIDPSSAGNVLSEAVKELAVKKPENPLDAYAQQMRSDLDRTAALKQQTAQAKMDLDLAKFDLEKEKTIAQISKDYNLATKDTQDKLVESQQGLTKTKDYIDNLESAIQMSGETGGSLFPGIEDKAREAKLNWQASGGDAEAQRRLAGRRLLKNSQIDAAGEVRKAFPGAVQIKEMELYMSTGGSTSNLPAVNKAILDKAKLAYQAAAQSHAFIAEAVKKGKTYSDALNLYEQYNREVPLFIKSQNGERIINPERLAPPKTEVPGSTPMPQATPSPDVNTSKMGLDEFISWKKQQGL